MTLYRLLVESAVSNAAIFVLASLSLSYSQTVSLVFNFGNICTVAMSFRKYDISAAPAHRSTLASGTYQFNLIFTYR